jgi:hypothetical protein
MWLSQQVTKDRIAQLTTDKKHLTTDHGQLTAFRGVLMANRVAQEAFNHLVGDLRATHGENLASVMLYGSAAAGDHIDESSDYNLLCVNGGGWGTRCRSILRRKSCAMGLTFFRSSFIRCNARASCSTETIRS